MLKGLAFMGSLDEPDIEWLVANSKRRDIQSGSALIRQGEPVESLYLILDGKFNVTVLVPKEHQVAVLLPGELVGEMSFVDTRPPSATATAGMNSSVLAIASPALNAKIAEDIGFAARFYKGISVLLSNRLRDADNGAYNGEPDLRDGAPHDDQDELAKSQMATLAKRFDDIHRRLESQRSAKGA